MSLSALSPLLPTGLCVLVVVPSKPIPDMRIRVQAVYFGEDPQKVGVRGQREGETGNGEHLVKDVLVSSPGA